MYRTVSVVALLACHAACAGDDKKKSREPCTEAELGATRCDDDIVLECDGSFFVQKEDCAETHSTCQQVFSAVARCEAQVPPGGLFDVCVGTGQGTCESDDLTCGAVTLLSGDNLCLNDCTQDASICDTIQLGDNVRDGYCESGRVDDTQFATSPFCFWKAERNGACFFDDAGCADTTHSCRGVAGGLNPECKLTCPGGLVGTEPEVCADQECLAAPYVEIEQLDGGGDKECTTPDTPDNCSSGDGYECAKVATGDTTTEILCARRAGLCGTTAPAAPAFASASDVADWIDTRDNLCDRLGADQYCGPDDAAGALNECVRTTFAFAYPSPVRCDSATDDVGCFGLGRCMTFDGTNFQCAVRANVCQRFCTGRDGEDLTLNGSVNPCDTGSCQVPAAPVGLPAVQFDEASGEAVRCDSNPSACTGNFTCDTETFADADVCTQVRKVCTP